MYADGTHLPELSATKVEPPKDFPKSLLLDNWLGLLTNTRDFIPQFSLWGGRECRVSLPHGFPRPMPAREEQKAAAVSCVLLLLKPRVLSNGICTAAERGQRLPSFSLFQAKRTPRPAARYFSRILQLQHSASDPEILFSAFSVFGYGRRLYRLGRSFRTHAQASP
jgi:hypothetical protein